MGNVFKCKTMWISCSTGLEKKIEKVKFVEVNLKRAVITLLITVLFAKLSVCSVI